MQVEDKIGKKFGRLTVVKLSPNKKYGKRAWECLCDCGSNKVETRTSHHLNSGRKPHCGCSFGKIKNLEGSIFGFLKVIGGPFKNSSGRIAWKTRCICGTEKKILSKSLINGDAISCRCRGAYKKVTDWAKVPLDLTKFIAHDSPERHKNIYFGPYICQRCSNISLFQSSNSNCVSCSFIKTRNKKAERLVSLQSKEHLHRVIRLETARKKGLKRYFNAIPCPAGHIADRFVTSQGCTECARLKITDPAKQKIYAKRYYSKLGSKTNRNARLKHNRENDPAYLVMSLCRARISKIFREKNIPKNGVTKELIGADNWGTVAAWIESKFYNHPITGEAMTWENRSSEWEIDHITPLALLRKMSTFEQQKEICNYRNLQPLWKIDHLEKTLSQRKITHSSSHS